MTEGPIPLIFLLVLFFSAVFCFAFWGVENKLKALMEGALNSLMCILVSLPGGLIIGYMYDWGVVWCIGVVLVSGLIGAILLTECEDWREKNKNVDQPGE